MSLSELRVGILPPSEQIRVEELINYHRHILPEPAGNEPLTCTMQRLPLENGKQLVQIGLATPSTVNREQTPPLNLVLVVDCSGSMSGDRIEKVRSGLLTMCERLRPNDQVSLVVFSDEARLQLPACQRTNLTAISQAIQGLQASGSTNLHSGLMLGYEEATRHFDPQRSNRVILLTDGIANVGTVDSDEISRQSKEFNRKKIDLSTIGVGTSFNRELLRSLADAGHGLAYFVADGQELEKIFATEVESLLTPVARKLKLKIRGQFSENQVEIFGYQPRFADNEIRLTLDNLNANATQVIMTQFENQDCLDDLSVELSFEDARSGESISIHACQESTVAISKLQFADIQKNYAIALVAQGIKDAATLCESGKTEKAISKLKKTVKKAKQFIADHNDVDLQRVVKIAEKGIVANMSKDPN